MDQIITPQAILEARDELGLGSDASLKEIKSSYLHLAKKHHPDKNPKELKDVCEKRMQAINHAYELILTYTQNYRYSFDKETVEKNADFFKWWFGRFGTPGTGNR